MKRPQLYWLIIIFVLVSFLGLGLGLFYARRILTTSVPTKSPIPLVAPVENLTTALLKAFDSCAQGPGGDTERIKELLSPFGEVVGLAHPWEWVKAADGGLRACLFVVKEGETTGTVYFVVASSEKGLEVATIQYNNK